MYTSSLMLSEAEFIGIWLAVKVAAQWKRWEDPEEGRKYFNAFLIGNGISILYAAVAAKLVDWIISAKWSYALSTLVAVPVATLLLVLWEKKYKPK